VDSSQKWNYGAGRVDESDNYGNFTRNRYMTPKAFVIMPFSENLNEIYNLFIASTLAEAGYDVFRADDIINQRNILEDIIEAIQKSDLIIADLTGSNPNVYYELGLAHAFGKPVILLTQSVSELPFDLRSYRVILYSTHFAAIGDAKANLLELAKSAKDGKIIFRNPVTDFAGTTLSQPTETNSDELGFLDHLIRMQDGFSSMSTNIGKITEKMLEMNNLTDKVTDKLNGILQSKINDSPRRAQELFSDFAIAQNKYVVFLKQTNDKISEELNATSTSLEYIVTYNKHTTDDAVTNLQVMLNSLDLMERNGQGAIDSFLNLVATLKKFPLIEKNLTKSINQVIPQLERFIGYTEQVVAMASKSKNLIEKMIKN
jgi:hypothetical protein